MSDLWDNLDRIIETRKLKLDGIKQDDSIFRFRPVPFKEFVESRQYCAFIPLSRRQLEACYAMLYGCSFEEYDTIKDQEINIFDKPKFNTAVLLWGKGAGKDTICALLTLYVAYYLICCKSPQMLLGLPENEAIDIVNVAYSGEQANRVFFEKLKQRIIGNAWLRKYFSVQMSGGTISEKTVDQTNQNIVIGQNAIIFPNLIRLFSRHSEQESTEGLNLLMFTMDEADAFKDRTSSRNADKIFNMLQTSAESRFGNKYKGFCISYPRTDRGFMMRMMKMAERDLHIYADRAFTWEVKAEMYAKSDRFNFEVKSKDANNKDLIQKFLIPMDFKSSFDRNPTMARTMYMCMPPGAESPFIEYLDKLYECVNMHRNPILTVEDYVEHNEVKKKIIGWDVSPEDIEYVVSVDLGEKHDKCALSIMHRDGTRAIHDLSISWKPIDPEIKQRRSVSLINVREFIKSLSKRIRFICIFDKWQSSMFVQELKADGIHAETISTSNIKDYNDFMQFLYTQRLDLLNNEELLEEIKALERDEKGRVDHTQESHNDICDTIVRGLKVLFKEELITSKESGEFIANNLLYQGGDTVGERNI